MTALSIESLRAEFDGIFAAPSAGEHAAQRVLLTVRLGGDPFAIPIEALSGLKPRQQWVPIPSRNPHFLGLAGLEGSLVPVFRLPALLGYSVPDDRLRWVALCNSVALALEAVEGTVRVSPDSLSAPDRNETHHPCVQSIMRVAGLPHSVLNMDQIMAELEQHAERVPKEKRGPA